MLIVSPGVTLTGSKRLIRSLLGLVLFLGVVAYDARAQEHSEYAAADVAAGARVYGSMCASCHGVNGAGIGGIDLRRGPLRRAGTDAGLREVVTTGIQGTGMPGFRLEPDELRGLVAFVRVGLDATANGPTVVLGDPGRGRAVLEGEGQCLTCHRVGDKGAYVGPDLTEIGRTRTPVAIRRSLVDPTGSMRPINRPVEAITNSGSVIRGRRLNEDSFTVQLQDDQGHLVSLVKSDLRKLTISTTSPMPAYGEKLTPAALADLVSYLLTLNGSQP